MRWIVVSGVIIGVVEEEEVVWRAGRVRVAGRVVAIRWEGFRGKDLNGWLGERGC